MCFCSPSYDNNNNNNIMLHAETSTFLIMFWSLIRNFVGQLEWSQTPVCLGGLVWGTVFTLSVISAVRWMCSSDKCFPWWGPYLTTNHLSPERDDDLKLPLFSLPCILVSPQASVATLFGCWLPSPHRGVGALPNPQVLNKVSFSALVNEKLA